MQVNIDAYNQAVDLQNRISEKQDEVKTKQGLLTTAEVELSSLIERFKTLANEPIVKEVEVAIVAEGTTLVKRMESEIKTIVTDLKEEAVKLVDKIEGKSASADQNAPVVEQGATSIKEPGQEGVVT